MESSLARALQLWEEGAPGDPGLLNPAVVPWIAATCRYERLQLKEALKRVDEALAVAALSAAVPLIDGKKKPSPGIRERMRDLLPRLDAALARFEALAKTAELGQRTLLSPQPLAKHLVSPGQAPGGGVST